MMQLNYINLILIGVFLYPLITASFKPFTAQRVLFSLESLLDNIEFLFGLLLSIYVTKKVFFENDAGVYKELYLLIPVNLRAALHGQDVLIYIVSVPIMLMVITLLLRLITNPVYRSIIVPLSERIYLSARSMSSFFRNLIGVLWQLPRSIIMVLIFSLIINFSSYYLYIPTLSNQLSDSTVYRFLYRNALQPALSSNIAKQIPVIVNDSFRKTVDGIVPPTSDNQSIPSPDKLINRLTGGNVRVIEYFNGVTLDQAIKSSAEIDETARKIVGNEKDSKKKAYLLYKWICRNIKYDYEKVKIVSSNPRGVSSGSIEAYETKKGICFDYSSLYVSMSRAVGLKVRLVTGLAYSGVAWGDHAWNQVFSSEENRWINVDTTFGTTANYFDKSDFSVDHKYDEVQGEW